MARNYCEISGCNGVCVGRGLCRKHYDRKRRGQDITAPSVFDARDSIINEDHILIPLGLGAKDGYAIIDKDYRELCERKWVLSTIGYPITTGRPYKYMHHLVIGNPSKSYMVDHINRNKLDNRMGNLRFVDSTNNNLNRGIIRSNTSGTTGVYKVRNSRLAKMSYNKKQIYFGYFKTKEEAIKARIEGEKNFLANIK